MRCVSVNVLRPAVLALPDTFCRHSLRLPPSSFFLFFFVLFIVASAVRPREPPPERTRNHCPTGVRVCVGVKKQPTHRMPHKRSETAEENSTVTAQGGGGGGEKKALYLQSIYIH